LFVTLVHFLLGWGARWRGLGGSSDHVGRQAGNSGLTVLAGGRRGEPVRRLDQGMALVGLVGVVGAAGAMVQLEPSAISPVWSITGVGAG
jgi:hypothetical protein